MERKFKILFLLLTSILLTGIAVPCVIAQHFEYNAAIPLTPTNMVDSLAVSLNSGDRLWYEFKATNTVTFWVEDPTGSQIETPYNYVLSDYSSPLWLDAVISGTYSLKFSLPQGVPNNYDNGYNTVEIKYGFDRSTQPTTASTYNSSTSTGSFDLVSVLLLIIMTILAVIAVAIVAAIGLSRKAQKTYA